MSYFAIHLIASDLFEIFLQRCHKRSYLHRERLNTFLQMNDQDTYVNVPIIIDLGKNANGKGSNWCHKCIYLYRDEDFYKWMITIQSANVPIINLAKNTDRKISNWRHKCSYFYRDVLNYQWLPMHPRGYKCFSHKPLKECRELKKPEEKNKVDGEENEAEMGK